MLKVIVPDDGVKTPEPPTVNVPVIVAVPAPVEIELAEMVKLL